MKLLNESAFKAFQASWNKAKTAGDWTQAKMAKALNMAQPSFNQYLKGIIPLNLEFVLRYCAVLKIDPQTLGVTANVLKPTLTTIPVKVLFSTSGIIFENGEVRMISTIPRNADDLFLVEVDSEFRNIPKGSYLACSKLPSSVGALVVAKSSDGKVVVGTLTKSRDTWVVIQPLVTGDLAVAVNPKDWTVSRVDSIVFADAAEGEIFGG
jgi:transcriptional regulator with XRE-family HTH domain